MLDALEFTYRPFKDQRAFVEYAQCGYWNSALVRSEHEVPLAEFAIFAESSPQPNIANCANGSSQPAEFSLRPRRT